MQNMEVLVPITVTESAPLDMEIDLPLSGFVKTGNPTQLNTLTLTATGGQWYDAIGLRNTLKTRKSVEVYAADWSQASDRPMPRLTDQWRSPDTARVFAEALLSIYSEALAQYTETVDWNSPVQLGDLVTTLDGDLVVNAVSWDPDTMTKTVRAGQRVRDTFEWIQSVNGKMSDLERMV